MWAVKAIEGEARVVEVPRPVPGPGEVLIEVRAAGVNRADLLQVAGHYDPPPGAPDTLGIEVAGVVVEVGAGVPVSRTGWDARWWLWSVGELKPSSAWPVRSTASRCPAAAGWTDS